MTTAVVIGGDGKLGLALRAELARYGDVVWTSRREQREWMATYLDLLAPRPVGDLCSSYDAVLFLVAAVTSVVQCEHDASTWLTNVDAPCLLAVEARERGWRVVFVSSDAVEIAPHTNYAKQKAHAEAVVLAAGGVIFRPGRIAPGRYTEVAVALAEFGMRNLTQRIMRWRGP